MQLLFSGIKQKFNGLLEKWNKQYEPVGTTAPSLEELYETAEEETEHT